MVELQKERDGRLFFLGTAICSIEQQLHAAVCALEHKRSTPMISWPFLWTAGFRSILVWKCLGGRTCFSWIDM